MAGHNMGQETHVVHMSNDYINCPDKISRAAKLIRDSQCRFKHRPLILGTAEELSELIRIFRYEKSYKATSEAVNVCASTVIHRLSILRLAGVDLPHPSKLQPKRGMLSPDHALATYLLAAGGMKCKDIAANLGISYSAAKYRIERGQAIHLRLPVRRPATLATWLSKPPWQLRNSEACLLHLYDLSREHNTKWPSLNIPPDYNGNIRFSKTLPTRSATGSPAARCTDL